MAISLCGIQAIPLTSLLFICADPVSRLKDFDSISAVHPVWLNVTPVDWDGRYGWRRLRLLNGDIPSIKPISNKPISIKESRMAKAVRKSLLPERTRAADGP